MDALGCLGPGEPLPAHPQRVLVNGASGAGKTTLAAELGRRLDLPHTEIDALHWGPGWTSRPEFEADVATMAAGARWVTELQYRQVREVLTDRADLVVWLDLPRRRVLAQVARRTVARRLRRTPLWGGLVEPPLWTILVERDHIVRWSWRTHSRAAVRVAELRAERPDLPVVRLRSHAEARQWLDLVSGRG